MGTVAYRQKTAASEIQFFRLVDVSSSDFDGTDTASMSSTLLDPYGYNNWAEGFYILPEAGGDVVALSYVDWYKNGKVIDDSLAQVIPSLAAGIMHPIRVVKIYAAGTISNNILIGV